MFSTTLVARIALRLFAVLAFAGSDFAASASSEKMPVRRQRDLAESTETANAWASADFARKTTYDQAQESVAAHNSPVRKARRVAPFAEEDVNPSVHNWHLTSWVKSNLSSKPSLDVLDVGGGDGFMKGLIQPAMLHINALHYKCIDLTPTGHACTEFSGKGLEASEFPDKCKDVILFNYVLHHAGEHTIPLLQSAKRVARQYVVIQEDMKALSPKIAQMQWAHGGPGSTFRGPKEWKSIFKLLGFELVKESDYEDGGACEDSYRCVPRTLFVLKT